MSIDGLSDATIRSILEQTRRIALVGASAKSDRPSNEVMSFLLRQGYDVTPVNPGLAGTAIFGRTMVDSLDAAAPVEMVDVFRASDQVGPIVDAAIRLGASVIWMQLGVVNLPAAEAARAVGITVVMDRCPVIETARLRPRRSG
jgi:predicted CoA-binding protein